MRVDIDNTYIFLKGNKNKLVFNPPDDTFEKDFTILCEFTPDRSYNEENCMDGAFHTMGLLCKNGQHMGLFYTVGINEVGEVLHKISFEWWSHTEEPGVDTVQSVDIYVGDDVIYNTVQVSICRQGETVIMNADGQTATSEIKNVIDYGNSYTWLGCANRLSPDFQHIYHGDLSKLHFQEDILEKENIDLFFKDISTFCYTVARDMSKTILFTSDFEEISTYKVKDLSYNSNHLIRYSERWLG